MKGHESRRSSNNSIWRRTIASHGPWWQIVRSVAGIFSIRWMLAQLNAMYTYFQWTYTRNRSEQGKRRNVKCSTWWYCRAGIRHVRPAWYRRPALSVDFVVGLWRGAKITMLSILFSSRSATYIGELESICWYSRQCGDTTVWTQWTWWVTGALNVIQTTIKGGQREVATVSDKNVWHGFDFVSAEASEMDVSELLQVYWFMLHQKWWWSTNDFHLIRFQTVLSSFFHLVSLPETK